MKITNPPHAVVDTESPRTIWITRVSSLVGQYSHLPITVPISDLRRCALIKFPNPIDHKFEIVGKLVNSWKVRVDFVRLRMFKA
ncbi:hypothetical protein B0G81_6469 [Paraburkholderia sp. BL6665CI2N2]|nr:hypothetical protein B0G81_6469 [Paraburkholderia sp. BL6665CI2N2]